MLVVEIFFRVPYHLLQFHVLCCLNIPHFWLIFPLYFDFHFSHLLAYVGSPRKSSRCSDSTPFLVHF